MEQIHKYKVTVGDIKGNANAILTDDMARAEQYATRMLGKEWGDDREITIARIYKWDGTAYKFHSEMEW